MLVVRVLGRLRVWHGASELDIGPPARRHMLGLLALNAGRLTTRRELVESMWGERPPSSAINVLHTQAKHLRRLLDPQRVPRDQDGVLSTVGDGYLLRLPEDALDLHRFRRAVRAAQAAADQGDPGRAVTLLRDALRLWEDDPLCDVPALDDHPTVWGIKSERRQAQLSYWELSLRSGGAAEVVAALTAEAAAHPLDEAVQAMLIRAYQATGQRTLAFERYAATRHALAEELGVEPGAELTQAHRHLLDGSGDSPTLTVPRQLPAPVPDFVGRTGELGQLDAVHAAGTCGVVVICGTAGVGKTAFAVHWGHRRRARFPDGWIHLDLRGDEAEHAVTAHEALGRLLAALAVPDAEIPSDTGARAARWRTATDGRRLFVLLDNVASADQVRPLLPGSRAALVVVTSRDRQAALVALHGAYRIELDLLPPSDAAGLLTRLLDDRAGTDPASVDSLAAICARLPLALRLAAEYAAAQAHLPLAGIVSQLRQASPLDLLDAGGSAAIRHVFGWSYQRLDAATQRLFRLLSLHPAPYCTLACAAALSGADEVATGQLMRRLTSAHLMRCDPLGRYAFHDLLRAYAAELSLTADEPADRDAAVDRLLTRYVDTAVAASDALHPEWSANWQRAGLALKPGGERLSPDAALAWLDGELLSFAAICRFARRHGRPEYAVKLAAAVYRYLEAGYGVEATAIHEQAIDAARELGDLAAEAHLRTNAAVVERLLSRYASAAAELGRALELCRRTGNRHSEARILSNLGIVEERLGELASSAARHHEAVAIYQEINDAHGQASALTNLGNLESAAGDHASAAERFLAAHDIFAALGARTGQAIALTNLGDVHIALGEDVHAAGRLWEALVLFREIGHRDGEATALSNLGTALSRQGLHQESIGSLQEALGIFRDTGNRYGEASVLNAMGDALSALGRDDDAVERYRSALAIAGETGDSDERNRAVAALDRIGTDRPTA
ncbi:tetratricopeptide repeat protein [Solwaraspora sp. WMMD792]|uniref:AfsR/SARP family transcriptional regulator n=1 Tax=Solwaraspora sp. WMMD792 TaxID=3016099 RepID=UPI0024171FB8|nr:tetratricopeptide repeat protein [Solwaraspora sp. WMMD792]MDG4769768.1 BTAD domain-containing putative transcriptional regulator [Solwaraspora sp. WMMD792]